MSETIDKLHATASVVALHAPSAGPPAPPGFFADDVTEFAGAGVSTRREDSLVPFLYIAQSGSPQVKKGPLHVDGMEEGFVFDTSTGQMWRADQGEGPLLVQFFFEAAEVEWGLRGSDEQGFKGRHAADTPLLRQIREVPKSEGTGVNRIINNGHQLVTTKYHYMILAEQMRMVAVALSSSALQASRALNTMLSNKKVRGRNGIVTAPAFATLVRMRTVAKSAGGNTWFVPVFDDLGFLPDKYADVYGMAKEAFQSARDSGIKTESPPAEDYSPRTEHDDLDNDTVNTSPL